MLVANQSGKSSLISEGGFTTRFYRKRGGIFDGDIYQVVSPTSQTYSLVNKDGVRWNDGGSAKSVLTMLSFSTEWEPIYEDITFTFSQHCCPPPKVVSVDLNSSLTATVHHDHVMVGCQKVDFSKVEEVYNVVMEAKRKAEVKDSV